MASRKRHGRRDSMDQPPNISDVIQLNVELNRLHKDLSPEYNKHLDKVCELIDDFKKDRLAIYILKGGVLTAGIAIMFAVLGFFLDDDDLFIFFSEVSIVLSLVAFSCVAFGRSKNQQRVKNLQRTVKEELNQLEDKITPTIDKMEEICQRTEKLLKQTLLLDQTVQALNDHFTHSFEKTPIFQTDFTKTADLKLSNIVDLPGKLSEVIAKVSSVPYILQEIVKEDKRRKDKPAKIIQAEFKEKVDKYINGMQKEICLLKNILKQINQIADKMSNLMS